VCVAQFTVASIPTYELLGLGRAYLAAGQPTDAAAAFNRYMETLASRPVRERAWAMYRIVDNYIGIPPSRLADAEQWMAKLDALDAPPERMLAHLTIAGRGLIMDSIALTQRHVDAVISNSARLTGDSAKKYVPVTQSAYVTRAQLEMRRDQFDSARATIKEAKAYVGRVSPPQVGSFYRIEPQYAIQGDTAKRIEATTWHLPAGGTPPAMVPARGTAQLIVFVSSACGDGCYAMYATLRALNAKHPQFPVILVTRTTGRYRNRLASPDSEATLVGDYFATVAKLPFPLAIWRTGFGTLADGRKTVQSAPNDENYRIGSLGGVPAYLVDAQGIIRRAGELNWSTYAMYDHAIQRLLR